MQKLNTHRTSFALQVGHSIIECLLLLFHPHAPMTSLANPGDSTAQEFDTWCCTENVLQRLAAAESSCDESTSTLPHSPALPRSPSVSHSLTTTTYFKHKMTAAIIHCHRNSSNPVIALQNTTTMEKRCPSGGLLHVHGSISDRNI